MSRGRRIIIEGMDGTGKSTLVKAICHRLEHRFAYPMPSHHNAAGKLIRRCFTGEEKLAPQAMLPLFVADAIDCEPEIEGLLNKGTDVILDRHTSVSGWAYQAEHHTVETIDAVTIPGYYGAPYAVFILDCTPEIALERQRARKGKAVDVLYEKDDIDYVGRLRSRYVAYAMMHERCMVIDAEKTTNEMVAVIMDALTKFAEVDAQP